MSVENTKDTIEAVADAELRKFSAAVSALEKIVRRSVGDEVITRTEMTQIITTLRASDGVIDTSVGVINRLRHAKLSPREIDGARYYLREQVKRVLELLAPADIDVAGGIEVGRLGLHRFFEALLDFEEQFRRAGAADPGTNRLFRMLREQDGVRLSPLVQGVVDDIARRDAR